MGYYSQGYGNLANQLNTPIKAVQAYLIGKAALKGNKEKPKTTEIEAKQTKEPFEGEPKMDFSQPQQEPKKEEIINSSESTTEIEPFNDDAVKKYLALNTAQNKLEVMNEQKEAWKNTKEIYKKKKLEKEGI